MDVGRRAPLLGVLLAGLAAAGPAAAQSDSAREPWSVQLAVARPSRQGAPGHAAPVPTAAARPEERREEASVEARYRLELAPASRVTLRYRGALAREGDLAPLDRQRHRSTLSLQQRLGAGWTARLGWESRAAWTELGEEGVAVDGRGFAELGLAREAPWGRPELRYELWRGDLLAHQGPLLERHRLALVHVLPRTELAEGLALRLVPRLALERSRGRDAAAREVLGAALSARLAVDAGASLQARLAYERRAFEREAAPRRERALDAAARLEAPVGERLRLRLELGGRRVEPLGRGASVSALRAQGGFELRF